MNAVLPGSTVGILGGGQLGRMLALAARQLGYRVACLDPEPNCAARPVVDICITAPFSDPAAGAALAKECAVVTVEIEKLAPALLGAVVATTPLHPSAQILEMVQHRERQKQWLFNAGFPLAEFRSAHNADELAAALKEFSYNAFVKTCEGGFDGRGQERVREITHPASLWEKLGQQALVIEKPIAIAKEISVLVARNIGGNVATYPVAENYHENQILSWTLLPARIPAALEKRAQELAREIAQTAKLCGLLTIEMFVTEQGDILVNELAPRPHNSYHGSEFGCVTSQFEQGIRAACNLPLGSTAIVQPTAMRNLLGDVWANGEPAWSRALADADVKLRLYGKAGARPGRKMGHLCASAPTGEEALLKVQAAYQKLL